MVEVGGVAGAEFVSGEAGGGGAAFVSGAAGVEVLSVVDEADGVAEVLRFVSGAVAVASGEVAGSVAGLVAVKVTPSTLYFWRSDLKTSSICM